MRLVSVEVRRLELTLAHRVDSGAGSHRRRPVVLVRCLTDEASGDGECAALAAPSYTAEYADGAEAVLLEHLAPLLLERDGALGPTEGSASRAVARLGAVRGHPMAKAALEMALLDAELRALGANLAEELGATKRSISAGATIGLGEPDSVLAEVAEAVGFGFRHVKVKVAPGHDLEPLRAIRSAFPDLVVGVDANGAYDIARPEDRVALGRLDEFGLVALEQPLRPDDLLGHAELVRTLATPVVLDESVTGLGDLETALALGACGGVSIKAPRLGGLRAASAVLARCRLEGLPAALGGMFETGLGRAASIALGCLEGFDLPGDLGPSERYFSPDLTAPHVMVDGELTRPAGPGLGVELLRDVVESATLRSRTVGSS